MMMVIATMMLPPQVVIIPMYLVWAKQLHLTGTLWPLIIPMAFGDAFSIFLLRQFLLTIPSEYIDAAKVDGCGELRRPAAGRPPDGRPAIAAVALFQFFYCWNDYFGPQIYASENPGAWTLSYGLSIVQERPPHQLEPDHGRDPAGDGAGDHRVLLRPEGLHRGRHADRGQGMKLAVVGGGSTYTPELVDGLARLRDVLPVDELVLVDPAAERLELVGGRGAADPRPAGPPGPAGHADRPRRRRSTACDAVLLQLRVGGQAARNQDETWPLECGCVGQETTGAGGLAKALRTVPVVLDIAERVAQGQPRTRGSSTSPTRSAS